MKTTHILAAALAAALLSACSTGNGNGSNHEEAEEHHTEEVELTRKQMETVGIRLGRVEEKELGDAIRANGELRLNPQDRAEVTSLVGGIVRGITVVEGSRVRAGQAVAYIENTEIVEMQKNYLVASKEADMAGLERKRQESLAAQGAGVEKTLQQATANHETARARRTGLAYQLRQIGIDPRQVEQGKIATQVAVRAAIAGTVGRINESKGSYVDVTAPLMEIMDNAAVYCSLGIFEKNIGQVAVGQQVDFVVTNSPSTHLKGEVYGINKAMDPATKAIAVNVRIKDDGGTPLVAGMGVTALIDTGKRKVSALPDGAIVSADGKKYVFMLEGTEKGGASRFKRVEVVTGATGLGYTQVDFVSPVPADATIVTANAFYLASMAADHGEH